MSELYCKKCGSDQLTANTKGFSAGKAIVGGVLTGGVGLLAGFHGKGKVIITCLSCGNKFKPGEGSTTPIKTHQEIIESLPVDLLNIAKTEGFNKAVVYYSKVKEVTISVAFKEVSEILPEYSPNASINNTTTGKVDNSGCAVVVFVIIFVVALLFIMETISK